MTEGHLSQLPTTPSFWNLLVCVYLLVDNFCIEFFLVFVSPQWQVCDKIIVVPKSNN